jgi:TolB-like protein
LLQLRLLGPFEASDAARAKVIAIGAKKNRALLGFLALQPNQSATRSALAGLLWSDRDEAHARNSLRQSLLSLKKDLGEVHPAPILLQEDLIGLTPGQVMIDVLKFKQLAVSSALGDLQAAVSGYTGAFLEQLSIRDPSYEEWVADSRAHLSELLGSTLERLWQRQEGEERIASLRQLLSFDPVREAAHRALMVELARQGDLAGALQQYERCKSLLRQELDVAPSAETETVRRQIFEGRVPAVTSEPAGAPASAPVPAVVVLPFFNVGGDPEQQYFSDGITNDLTTDLSRFPAFRVIASHSAFAVRDKGANLATVARELGVRYVVEGSVQRLGRQIRINAQLIDASTGHHIWSERYNRSLRALFALQDEIVRNIVSRVAVRLEISERERALRKPTKSLEAYDYYLRGQEDWVRWTPEANRRAQELFRKALELDRKFARAYSALSYVLIQSALAAWTPHPEEVIKEALTLAETAVALAPSNFEAHGSLGSACLYNSDFERSLACYQKALELNPHGADLLADMADTLVHVGRTAEAVEKIAQAKELNPLHPDWYDWVLGIAAYNDGRYEEAYAALSRVGNPPNYLRRHLAATLVCLGRFEEANAVAKEMLQRQPGYRLATETLTPYKDPGILQAFIGQLRRAGLPD